jgi:uncharacterized membrane protein YtjA (UPF0391 family)
MQLLIGFVLGIIVSTIGFTGVAHYADQGVQKIKEVTQEVTK